jgi:type VI secretion system secreted protein VgrG
MKPIALGLDVDQEVQGRLRLLSSVSNDNEAILDGSYSIYTLEGISGVNKPYEFNITFISDTPITIESMVDTNAQIILTDVKDPLSTKTIFGMVFEAQEDSIVASKYLYKLKVLSPLHYMGLSSGYEIFLDKKAPDIITEIINRYAPLLNIKLDMRIDPQNAPVREYTTRYNQTPLEFITMLCEEEGYSMIVEYSSNDPYSITLCELNDHARVVNEPLNANYNTSKQFSSSHAINNFYDYDKPSLDMSIDAGGSMTSALKDNNTTAQLRTDLKMYDDKESINTLHESFFKDLRRYTTNDTQRGYVNSFEVKGMSKELQLNDSALVTLHSEKVLSQKQVITTEVKYFAQFPNALDEFVDNTDTQTLQYYTTFKAIPSDVIYKPQKSIKKPKIDGVLTAIVADAPESTHQHANQIDVDESARVRVIFHFEKDKAVSTYLRVMQPYAGNNYGFLFLPRVNTEVVVGFKDGNPDQPIILKTLSNGENKFPHQLPHKKTDSYIRTTSTPAYEDFLGYNEIRFDDTKEDELLFIRAQRDYELYAKHNFTTDITNNKRVEQTNKDEDIKHNFTQSVGNSTDRTIKANDIKTVEKEEVHTIKENKFLTTEKDYTSIIQENKREFIEQDLVDEIKEILHTYVEGDVTDKYLENFFLQVGQEMGVNLEGSLHIDTSSVKAQSATTTQIEATDGISLKCGGNVLTVNSSGIHFKTPNYKDNSGNNGVVGNKVLPNKDLSSLRFEE